MPTLEGAIAAIDDAGDAVYFENVDASPTVLFDGPDPDAPPAEEGPGPNYIETVALTPDLSTAYIGLCCEPISGSVLITEPPTPADPDSSRQLFGYGPAVSPDGAYVAVGQIQGVISAIYEVGTYEQLDVPAIDGPVGTYSPYDNIWLDDQRLVALGTLLIDGEPTWVVHPMRIDGTTVEVGSPTAVPLGDVDANTTVFRFSGFDRDDVYIHRDGATNQVAMTYTLAEPMPSTAADLVGQPARSVWSEPGQPTVWVDMDGALRVGATTLPGTYSWARA